MKQIIASLSLSFAGVLVTGLVSWGGCCFAAEAGGQADREKPEQAYERLLGVKQFAFGGVGYAGTTSDGEQAFRAVRASTNAVQLFRAALSNGSNEAKLYALCAIRQMDNRSFATDAKAFLRANPEVTTMSGCIVGHERAAAVVKRIAAGYYDNQASSTRR